MTLDEVGGRSLPLKRLISKANLFRQPYVPGAGLIESKASRNDSCPGSGVAQKLAMATLSQALRHILATHRRCYAR